MTDITSDCTFYRAKTGDLTLIGIVTPATAASSDTIDLNMDSAYAEVGTIIQVRLQTTTGTDVASCTWSNSTGIITLPSITTGVHRLLVVGAEKVSTGGA